MDKWGCGCDNCVCAERAMMDIAEYVDFALIQAENWINSRDRKFRGYALEESDDAARVASYFVNGPNPVLKFRDAVWEACK